MSTFAELQLQAHEISKSKGWYTSEAENIPGKLALIHAEVSEALEEYRNDKMELYYGRVVTTFPGGGKGVDSKPEGFGIELADVVIRVMDLAEYLKLPLEELIVEKMEFNKTRPFRHGGKKI